MPRLRWVKLWTQETLYGTTAKELAPDERAVWFGFLCLAGDSPVLGVICVASGVPYTPFQLSKVLNLPPKLLGRAIRTLISAGKIEVSEAGIAIKNWRHYQADTARVQEHRERKQIDGGVTDETPEDGVTNVTALLDKTRQDETRSDALSLKNARDLTREYERVTGNAITPAMAERLDFLVESYGANAIKEAMKLAVKKKKPRMDYIEGILRNQAAEGGNHGTSKSLSPEDRARWAIDNWEEGGYPDRAAAERDHGHAIPGFEPAKP